MAIPLSPLPGGSPLTRNSKIGKFWSAYGRDLDDPQAQQDCDFFSKELKIEKGCVRVGCMEKLSWNTFCTLLNKRQRLGWAVSIEGLLGIDFDRLSASLPLSAHLGCYYCMSKSDCDGRIAAFGALGRKRTPKVATSV